MATNESQLEQMSTPSPETHLGEINALIATMRRLNSLPSAVYDLWRLVIRVSDDEHARGCEFLENAHRSIEGCELIRKTNVLLADAMNTEQKERLEDLMVLVDEQETELEESALNWALLFRDMQ